METKTLSQIIADFALSMTIEEVPKNVIEHGKMLLTDTFGVAMSCQELDHAKAVLAAVRANDSATRCSLWGLDEKASLADAVLYNSCLIHGADFDDTHVASIIHPSAAVVSTAVTVGEYVGATGREMLEAIICGWEIIIRLGLAARGVFHDVGYHGTGIVASFASACVAAKLMHDSADVLVNAMGICGSQAAALQEFLQDGSWSKKIHPGWGCHSAIYALNMARNGFVGPKKVFEGKFGLYSTHCGSADGIEKFFEDFGTVWHTEEITVKLYPVCHMTHSFIDCMNSLISEYGFTSDEIESAECRIESRCYQIVCEPRAAKVRPATDYMMRFSLPYVVAMAAKYGKVSSSEIDLKYASEPEICELMDKIQCVDDDSKRNPGCFPGYLTVVLKDGRTLVKDQRYEVGTKQNPLNFAAVNKKFQDNLLKFYSEEQIRAILEKANNFEQLANAEELISVLHR